MDHNLIPPFVLREAGFIVNDVLRIHCHDITKDSHSIISNDGELRILLRLHGVFSFFPTFRPDDDHYHTGSSSEHYLMTPTGSDWNPNTTTIGQSVTVSTEPEWEIITPPSRTSFANNIIAREAMGQMAMSIGSTVTWNNQCLFPDDNVNSDGGIVDTLLEQT